MVINIVVRGGRPGDGPRPGEPGGRLNVRAWLLGATGIAVMAALVFCSYGGLDYWQGWVYFGLNMAVILATNWVLRNDPGLVAERLRPGKGMRWWDKVYFCASTPLCFAAVIVAGVDVGRTGWSPAVPAALYAAAVAAYLLGQALFLWAKKVNPFFSSVVRLQTDRGQTVCREGPYRYVRHPGYLAGLLFGLATPIVLGSFWALVPQALAAVLLVMRTGLEDRFLRKELLWYEEYTQAVRARLVPGLW